MILTGWDYFRRIRDGGRGQIGALVDHRLGNSKPYQANCQLLCIALLLSVLIGSLRGGEGCRGWLFWFLSLRQQEQILMVLSIFSDILLLFSTLLSPCSIGGTPIYSNLKFCIYSFLKHIIVNAFSF